MKMVSKYYTWSCIALHYQMCIQPYILTGGGNGYPFQYSCLENPMDREAWQTTVHGVTKSWT